MVTSYNGEVLRVNLTERTINVEPLDMEKAVKYIGGRGLGTRMLLDEGCATVEPLSADNKLIYITGPMTGTAVPTGGRYMVVTKSPLTDCLLQLWWCMGCYAEICRLGCNHRRRESRCACLPGNQRQRSKTA